MPPKNGTISREVLGKGSSSPRDWPASSWRCPGLMYLHTIGEDALPPTQKNLPVRGPSDPLPSSTCQLPVPVKRGNRHNTTHLRPASLSALGTGPQRKPPPQTFGRRVAGFLVGSRSAVG